MPKADYHEQTLEGHIAPITALDFSEPYGTLVSASQGDSQPRVWDLFSGTEISRLRGHSGVVKCLQVEDHVCLTGGDDGNVKLWDLRRVEDEDAWDEVASLGDVAEEDESRTDDGEVVESPNGIRSSSSKETSELNGPCMRTLEGHSQAVTSLYFEENCLVGDGRRYAPMYSPGILSEQVTGASDKTLRQWDLTTGQCVMTMDILWAISHPPAAIPGGPMSPHLFPGAAAAAGIFAVPTPPYADGSWDMYQDFVGGVQFWGYGLVSGSGDGAVRMWDSESRFSNIVLRAGLNLFPLVRTGQAHRTLLGHTGPVTCLQFDEIHIVSGSLDKSLRVRVCVRYFQKY